MIGVISTLVTGLDTRLYKANNADKMMYGMAGLFWPLTIVILVILGIGVLANKIVEKIS